MKHHFLFLGHLCDSRQKSAEKHAQRELCQPQGKILYLTLTHTMWPSRTAALWE